MNIKKIEKQLKKINQLFNTIKEDGSMSAIERDLMLSYIRGLYEKMIITDQAADTEKEVSRVSKSSVKAEISMREEAPPRSQHNIADVVMQEVAQADQYTPNTTTSSPKVESMVASQPATVITEVVEEVKPVIPQGILNLFEFEEVSELSDKLSRAPIADLTKCMGINEKIFTVQELFGGDSALFTRSMETMDKFTSLEQARDYLVENVAVDQNWDEEGKVKKASNFIKLISRRY